MLWWELQLLTQCLWDLIQGNSDSDQTHWSLPNIIHGRSQECLLSLLMYSYLSTSFFPFPVPPGCLAPQVNSKALMLLVAFYHVTASVLHDDFWCSKCSHMSLVTLYWFIQGALIERVPTTCQELEPTHAHNNPGRSLRILRLFVFHMSKLKLREVRGLPQATQPAWDEGRHRSGLPKRTLSALLGLCSWLLSILISGYTHYGPFLSLIYAAFHSDLNLINSLIENSLLQKRMA